MVDISIHLIPSIPTVIIGPTADDCTLAIFVLSINAFVHPLERDEV